MSQDKKLMIAGVLLLIIGFLSGWLGFLLLVDIAGSCKVLFISGDAIIRLEEERVKAKAGEDQSLFFGKKDEVLEKVKELAKSFEDRKTKVVFISSSSGKALGGVAISDEVHQRVIKALDEVK